MFTSYMVRVWKLLHRLRVFLPDFCAETVGTWYDGGSCINVCTKRGVRRGDSFAIALDMDSSSWGNQCLFRFATVISGSWKSWLFSVNRLNHFANCTEWFIRELDWSDCSCFWLNNSQWSNSNDRVWASLHIWLNLPRLARFPELEYMWLTVWK